MVQFYAPTENILDEKIAIQGEEARHLIYVLRKKPGDVIQVFDGQGQTYQVKIEKIEKDKIHTKILSRAPTAGIRTKLRLFQSLLKSPKMDYLIQKVTELGVDTVTPIFTARTTVKIDSKKVEGKLVHWRKIALNAAKQCGRAKLPVLNSPVKLAKALETTENNGLSLLLHEKEKEKKLEHVLKNLYNEQRKVNLFIGPEGGFTDEEINLAKTYGVTSVGLKGNILRSETAALVVLGVVLYECGEL